jgi:hypothetical protein
VPRRTFWFATGATAGVGSALWVRNRLLRAARRYTPERVQADVGDQVRRLGSDLRAAVREGRDAMADREAALRAELAPGSPAPGPESTTGVGPRHH